MLVFQNFGAFYIYNDINFIFTASPSHYLLFIYYDSNSDYDYDYDLITIKITITITITITVRGAVQKVRDYQTVAA